MSAIDLNHLHTALLALDADGRIRLVNTAAEHLLNLSAKKLVGQPLENFLTLDHPLADTLDYVRRSPASHLRQSYEWQTMGRSLLLDTLVSHQEVAGLPLFVFELRLNNTQLHAERVAQLQAQSATQRDFLRNLAHEIKNPLGGIGGAAQLIQQQLINSLPLPAQTDHAMQEYLTIITKEVGRLKNLVDQLLAPHRVKINFQTSNIHDICEQARQLVLFEFGERVQLRRDYDVSLPELTLDPALMLQVLLNLLQNACQAMTETPIERTPTITLKTRVAAQQTLLQQRHRLVLNVFVSDNGPGIPAHIQTTVFNPLVSTRKNGSGLGLFLAHQFVTQHGGELHFESSAQGTQFCISLPLSPLA